MNRRRGLLTPRSAHHAERDGYDGLTVTFTTSVQSPLGVPWSQKRMRHSRTSGCPATSSGRGEGGQHHRAGAAPAGWNAPPRGEIEAVGAKISFIAVGRWNTAHLITAPGRAFVGQLRQSSHLAPQDELCAWPKRKPLKGRSVPGALAMLVYSSRGARGLLFLQHLHKLLQRHPQPVGHPCRPEQRRHRLPVLDVTDRVPRHLAVLLQPIATHLRRLPALLQTTRQPAAHKPLSFSVPLPAMAAPMICRRNKSG